jgi:hypothetical protein
MSRKVDRVRTLRAIVVAAVLLIALIGAVLASVGTKAPNWLWASQAGAQTTALGVSLGVSGAPSLGTLPHDLERPA